MQGNFETKFQVMMTGITEMLPSKMGNISKQKPPAIQTSKLLLTGDGAMLKMDDASNLSISLTLFGQYPFGILKN
jgi:hypothetical protein